MNMETTATTISLPPAGKRHESILIEIRFFQSEEKRQEETAWERSFLVVMTEYGK